MDVEAPTPLLGGLSPAAFMRRHWQKKPLLVRGAWAGVRPPLARARLFELAARDEVESRLVQRAGRQWQVRHGPFARRTLPPLAAPGWTLLVQGLDLHVPAAHAMLDAFRFVPAARLDDLMVSWASPGGGVGPHLDSYDVFLLQLQGRRRWRIAPTRSAAERALRPGQPLKLLRRFVPTADWVLEPGDLLYLPPLWAHDGVAEGGACMTASIGFRSPSRGELARELLALVAEQAAPPQGEALYADPRQAAVSRSAAVPAGLRQFAREAVVQALVRPQAIERALGEWLSEPKPRVWFTEKGSANAKPGADLTLDAKTRMLHDGEHLYVNGESWRIGGRDATLLRRLADERWLAGRDAARLSPAAQRQLHEWLCAGWLHEENT
jgi:50S ribosomal protein L16 3-hydroxylase